MKDMYSGGGSSDGFRPWGPGGFSWSAIEAVFNNRYPQFTKVPEDYTAENDAELAIAKEELANDRRDEAHLEEEEEGYRKTILDNGGQFAPLSFGRLCWVLACLLAIIACLVTEGGNPFNYLQENYNLTDSPLTSLVMALPLVLFTVVPKVFVALLGYRNAGPQIIVTGLTLVAGFVFAYIFGEHFAYREEKRIEGFEEIVVRVSMLKLFLSQYVAELGICFTLGVAIDLLIRPREPKEVCYARKKLRGLQEEQLTPLREKIRELVKTVSLLEWKKTAFNRFAAGMQKNNRS